MLNRRHLFGLAGGAAVAAVLPKLPASGMIKVGDVITGVGPPARVAAVAASNRIITLNELQADLEAAWKTACASSEGIECLT